MQTTESVLDGFLTPSQLSKQLGVDKRTLSRWHLKRIGPPRVKVGRQIFYKVALVRAWLEAGKK